MRQILFRGKRKDNGKWVEGDLLTHNKRSFICKKDGHKWLPNDAGGEDLFKDELLSECVCEVIPATVGQFTGLLDKNGKEICEGDVVRFPDGKGAIAWSDNFCGWQISTENWNYRLSQYAVEHVLAVIGNVFDNPELLKEGTDAEQSH
jgi:uncharacterized phage protein (TIGR01671 family)